MLYSEGKERANRFLMALKISVPFLILMAINILYIIKNEKHSQDDIILLVILFLVYIYYVFYQIYYSFKTTLIDPISKTFNRAVITKILKKHIKNASNHCIVMIKIDNIADLSERYGLSYGDFILRKFSQLFEKFLYDKKIQKVPIGRYTGGYFLSIIDGNLKELKYNLKIFERKLANEGINGTEVKIKFSLIQAKYDKNLKNILSSLLEQIQNDDFQEDNIKPDIYDKLVLNAIKDKKFDFKFQAITNTKNDKIEIIEVVTRLNVDLNIILSKTKTISIVNRIGQEIKYDEKSFEALFENIKDFYHKPYLFLIEISPVSLRNTSFREKLKNLLEKFDYKADKFIIEFKEKKAYEEIQRFNEILIEYKKMGFKLALGRFGGENASVTYIKYLPIDYVNFDIIFTKNLHKEKFRKIISSYIQMAKTLDMKSLIRFIDKDKLLEISKQMGSDYIEGFIISKPKDKIKIMEEIK